MADYAAATRLSQLVVAIRSVAGPMAPMYHLAIATQCCAGKLTLSPLTRSKRKPPVTRGLRVGGRSQRVVSAVLAAAAEELARRGYIAFQIEEVARAAEVNRTSIYRRWPTKARLVEAALREISPFRHSQPQTGDLRRDLFAMLVQVVRWLRTTQGQSLRRMVEHDAHEPELARIVKALREESLAPWDQAINEAKASGELARNVDARLLTQMILSPVVMRIEIGERVDTRTLSTIVGIVVGGAGVARAGRK
jgi:AcrR family transcriptional regulator